MANGSVGRAFFERHSVLFFPGFDTIGVLLMEEKSQELAAHLNSGRPTNIRRPITYPCTVVNRVNSRKVKIQPHIGSSDDGVYLKLSDIQRLGLNDTGYTVVTRQGPCKVYSGVTFFFQNDYNNGIFRYHVPNILGLVADTVHSDATFNTRKEGIIGIPRIDKHLVFIHHSDVYIIHLSALSSLAQYFTNMVPLSDVAFDSALRPQFPSTGTYVADFSSVYSTALACQAPPYNVFRQNMTIPSFCFYEACRTCHKREGISCKLRICSQCKKEGRKMRALYCGEACQRADWQRHKAEHAGTQPWDVNSRPDIVVVPRLPMRMG
ncbi:uncharacterized protein EV420DRAFT_1523999 [Desarmillaria tabescens]|uniref:MYND-type domain-containing protein n=1 Tax=Armillaria tabescens TaxID=1929756 RepID=A0AA39NAZ6_ARMTA|nr:uncharacterized protein EV420DRAFT_1523999 [Desarmillaria tabescens]KAK0462310.1 hypothetical protein EV420DRAFT_1523999 [Desarmillaria tabescens]